MKDLSPNLVASCKRTAGWNSPKLMHHQRKPEDVDIPWPIRLKNLTPCSYFLWGHINNKVYDRNDKKYQWSKGGNFNSFQDNIVRNGYRGFYVATGTSYICVYRTEVVQDIKQHWFFFVYCRNSIQFTQPKYKSEAVMI